MFKAGDGVGGRATGLLTDNVDCCLWSILLGDVTHVPILGTTYSQSINSVLKCMRLVLQNRRERGVQICAGKAL